MCSNRTMSTENDRRYNVNRGKWKVNIFQENIRALSRGKENNWHYLCVSEMRKHFFSTQSSNSYVGLIRLLSKKLEHCFFFFFNLSMSESCHFQYRLIFQWSSLDFQAWCQMNCKLLGNFNYSKWQTKEKYTFFRSGKLRLNSQWRLNFFTEISHQCWFFSCFENILHGNSVDFLACTRKLEID